MLTRNCS